MNPIKPLTDGEYYKLTDDQKKARANKMYELLLKADTYLVNNVKPKTSETIIVFLDLNLMWQDLTHMTIEQAMMFRSYELCEELTEYFNVDDLIDAGEIIINDEWDADQEIERDHGTYDNLGE